MMKPTTLLSMTALAAIVPTLAFAAPPDGYETCNDCIYDPVTTDIYRKVGPPVWRVPNSILRPWGVPGPWVDPQPIGGDFYMIDDFKTKIQALEASGVEGIYAPEFSLKESSAEGAIPTAVFNVPAPMIVQPTDSQMQMYMNLMAPAAVAPE